MAQINIALKGVEKITKQLEKDAKRAEMVLTATSNDLRNRIPGMVADEVRKRYNVKKQEVMPAKKDKNGNWKKTIGSVSAQGKQVTNVGIVYKGRLLTPIHFAMEPRRLPRSKKIRQNKRWKKVRPSYEVTAAITTGGRKVLHSDAFLGRNKGGGYIPFRRTGKSAYPIESIKTTSLPQMIESPSVKENIDKKVRALIEGRLQHHITRLMK